MFDLNRPRTLPEQVKELLLVLSLQPIVCGIVNAVGLRFAAVFHGGWAPTVVKLAAFSVTGSFLVMDAWSVIACVLILREKEDLDIRPLAKFVLPLTALTGLVLAGLFFFGTVFANVAAAGCGLAAMLLIMLCPAGPPAADK